MRNFGLVWQSHPEVQGLVGCPTGSETATGVAFEQFEHGWMVQVSAPAQTQTGSKVVYVLFSDTGSAEAVPDTWVAGKDPVSTGQGPPAGLVEPQRDFGEVWREGPGVRGRLGWATAAERGANGAWQPFQHGQMIWTPDPKQIFVLGQQAPAGAAPNAWRLYPDLFVG